MRGRISCIAYERPALFRDFARSLAANDLTGWQMRVAVEPGPHQAEFAAICAADLPPGFAEVRINPRRLGLRTNSYQGLEAAFADTPDIVLSAEEDFVLAADALALCGWYARHARPHHAALNLLAGGCGSAGCLSDPAQGTAVIETRCFNSYGVGLTPANWALLSAAWAPYRGRRYLSTRDARHAWGWDWAVWARILSDDQLRVVAPVAARCNHTGAIGTYARPDFHSRAFGRLPLASPAAAPFTLCGDDDLPQQIAAHLRVQDESAAWFAKLITADRGRSELAAWYMNLRDRWNGIVR